MPNEMEFEIEDIIASCHVDYNVPYFKLTYKVLQSS